MAEKLRSSHEYDPSLYEDLEHQQQEAHSNLQEKGRQAHHEHAENIEHIRAKAEHEAERAHKTSEQLKEPSKAETDQPMLVNRELKQMAYRRTLKRARSHLPAPARAFSKVIHHPAVEAVSEVAGATVARPSGVLAGGITAFLGSSLFLWIARHYGYEYNFLLFAALFVGGFMIGLIIELILRLVSSRR